MSNETNPDIEERKKKRQGILLFVIFGGFIAVAIALMSFIDYYYAAENAVAQQRPRGAAGR